VKLKAEENATFYLETKVELTIAVVGYFWNFNYAKYVVHWNLLVF